MSERHESLYDSMWHLSTLVSESYAPPHPLATAFRGAFDLIGEDDKPSLKTLMRLERLFASLPDHEQRSILNGWNWFPSDAYLTDLEETNTGVGRSLRLIAAGSEVGEVHAEHFSRRGAWDDAVTAYIREGTKKNDAVNGLRMLADMLEANWETAIDYDAMCGTKVFRAENSAQSEAPIIPTPAKQEGRKALEPTAA